MMKPPPPTHLCRNPIGLFEENYRLLTALLPEWDEEESVMQLVGRQAGEILEVSLREVCRYTTVLDLHMPFAIHGRLLPSLQMQLRLYHDARVAEVTAYQGCRHIPAPYQVSGHGPWQPDEKRQVNLLLHELLRHCLRNGFQNLLEKDCP